MKFKAPAALMLALLLLGLLSCARQQDEEAELERLRAAIEQFHQAINSGDAERLVGMFTEDVILMSNAWETIRGKEEVAQVWTSSVRSGFRTKDQDIIDVAVCEDLGYEATTQLWTMYQEDQGAEWRSSKYVHLWRRQPDGTWKLHLDIWNNNPSPQ